jgi:hypothetical protein
MLVIFPSLHQFPSQRFLADSKWILLALILFPRSVLRAVIALVLKIQILNDS